METTLSLEESREFVALSTAGNLGQVEQWIRQGKSTSVHKKCWYPLMAMIFRKGFNNLLELLFKNTATQAEKDAVLCYAVRHQHFDQAKILVELGGNPLAVPFSDVVSAWDPEMVRYFMAKGTDIFADDQMARALKQEIPAALSFYMDYKRAHPDQAAKLQEQLDMALALHCRDGEERWVSMLMWAGGNPYAEVRDLERIKDADKSWMRISGVESAVRIGNVKILEMLDMDPHHSTSQELLYDSCFHIYVGAVNFLLNLGVKPNDKENGGSSGLDIILVMVDHDRFNISMYENCAEMCLVIARALIRHGAKWKPDDHELRRARRAMRLEPKFVGKFVKTLGQPGVTEPAIMEKLVGSRLMKEALNRDLPATKPSK